MALRAAVLAGAAAAAHAAYCSGAPNPAATPNAYPIFTSAPVLLNTTKNGKAYIDGPPGAEFHVLHLYGSPYEMGVAQGSLLRDEVRHMVNATWAYFVQQVDSGISFLPPWLAELIATAGLDVALDLLRDLTKPFTNSTVYDEMRGLADASGMDYDTIARVHLIGELTQGSCSMYGAWGAATAGGKTLSLRALDWDVDGPMKDFPSLIVYHPNPGGGHAWVNVGFLSWLGAMTGMNAAGISAHEIGVSFPDSTWFGSESFAGIPFVFLLREMLQQDASLADVINRMTTANRTCDLILGAGSRADASFRSVAYSASEIHFFDDANLQPWNNTPDTWHPRIPSVVYHGMDWDCPGFNIKLAQQLQSLYGSLTPENTVSNVTALVQTGDLHIAIYDLTDNTMFVSFAASDTSGARAGGDAAARTALRAGVPPRMAYDRPFTRIDMTALFAEPPPA